MTEMHALLTTPLAAARPLATPVARDPRTATAWLFVAPLLAGLLLFLVLPCVAVLVMSFTDWRLGQGSVGFAGLGNFLELASDRIFRNSALNTLLYALLVTPVSVGLGLWLAVATERSRLGSVFFRSTFFLPVVSTTVAMAIVWEFLLHPTLGPLPALLQTLGFPRRSLLGDADTVLPTLAFIGIWENAGYVMVLVMAGLKAIPATLYDAAAVDGADRPWDRFRTVTLPLLGPTLVFVVIIMLIRSFRVFETVAALTQGGPRRASEVLLFTVYQEGFVYFRIGYASAATVVFVALLLTLTLVKFRLLDRRVHYE